MHVCEMVEEERKTYGTDRKQAGGRVPNKYTSIQY